MLLGLQARRSRQHEAKAPQIIGENKLWPEYFRAMVPELGNRSKAIVWPMTVVFPKI